MDNFPTTEEVQGAKNWFFIVGLIAVGLAFSLASIDKFLHASDSEVRNNNTLKELRSAQASLETRGVDSRLLVTQSLNHHD